MQDRIRSVLEAVARDLAATRWFPESTYRVPLHAGFTFRDALHIMPYLMRWALPTAMPRRFCKLGPGAPTALTFSRTGGVASEDRPSLARSAGVDALSGGRRKGGDAA